ncbi:MAG: glycosyltransferase family 4 protein [Muribaculaceae bacterium]|nr:glycosyltransferase family 4 protein [Muribaculaceae bacterium]
MKALMFGWEFPPHILGGLGTASYGLTKGMHANGDMDITFVIPKPWGDEEKGFARIIGACNTPVAWRDVSWDYVQSRIGNVMDPQMYFNLRDHIYADFNYMRLNDLGCIEFSGKYPDNILEEINNYSIVAGVIARTVDFDIIHSHDWLTYPAGIHAKNVTGKPLVIHVHASEFDRSRGKPNPTVFAIEKDGMMNADHIITVSNLTRKTVIEKYGIDPAKVTTVHNAVIPLSDELLNLKRREGKDKVITFLGRITMQKGPEYFVEAAAKVLQKNKNVRFVMAGGGDMEAAMIKLAAKRGIADKFHFTGFLRGKEVYQMFRDSDVYVMPSVSEPFGISPLEAMEMGVPSIISKQSGCAEILDNVIKTDYWDIDAMADAMHALVSYPALHNELRDKGIEEIHQITWEKAGKKVIDIYKDVIEKRK